MLAVRKNRRAPWRACGVAPRARRGGWARGSGSLVLGRGRVGWLAHGTLEGVEMQGARCRAFSHFVCCEPLRTSSRHPACPPLPVHDLLVTLTGRAGHCWAHCSGAKACTNLPRVGRASARPLVSALAWHTRAASRAARGVPAAAPPCSLSPRRSTSISLGARRAPMLARHLPPSFALPRGPADPLLPSPPLPSPPPRARPKGTSSCQRTLSRVTSPWCARATPSLRSTSKPPPLPVLTRPACPFARAPRGARRGAARARRARAAARAGLRRR
jgi:hypothetical protein